MRCIVAIVPALFMAGCASAEGQSKAGLELDPDRCARLGVALDAARLRLANPLYLDEHGAELAKRAVADLELASVIAGCVPIPAITTE